MMDAGLRSTPTWGPAGRPDSRFFLLILLTDQNPRFSEGQEKARRSPGEALGVVGAQDGWAEGAFFVL